MVVGAGRRGVPGRAPAALTLITRVKTICLSVCLSVRLAAAVAVITAAATATGVKASPIHAIAWIAFKSIADIDLNF